MESRNAVVGLSLYGVAAFGWDAREHLVPVEPILTGPAIDQPPFPFTAPAEGHHEEIRALIESLSRNHSFTTTATINTFPAVRLQTSPPFAPMVDLAVTRALPWSSSDRESRQVAFLAFGGMPTTMPALASIPPTTQQWPWTQGS